MARPRVSKGSGYGSLPLTFVNTLLFCLPSSPGHSWPFFLPFAPERVSPAPPSGAVVPWRFAREGWTIIQPWTMRMRLDLLPQSSLTKNKEPLCSSPLQRWRYPEPALLQWALSLKPLCVLSAGSAATSQPDYLKVFPLVRRFFPLSARSTEK